MNMPACWRKLDAVPQQIHPNLIELISICCNLNRYCQLQMNLNIFGGPLRLAGNDNLPNLLVKIKGSRLERMMIGVQRCKLQQIIAKSG